MEELLYGTRCTRRHELNKLASGKVGWRLSLAMICDKRGLCDIDSIVLDIISPNIEQDDLNRVLTPYLISEKEQFLQFGVACAQE